MSRRHEKAVALVVTLVMLSIVTVMAVIFLGVSRRERASVKVTEDISTARLLADSAVAHAQAKLIGPILAATNFANFDYRVSTNYIQPQGYLPNLANNLTNVAYAYGNGVPLRPQHQQQMLANLFHDPRPPVFVTTNDVAADGVELKDFRFYLDLNRNGRFETNGVLPVLNANGFPLNDGFGGTISNHFVGDPEWIGVLEHPNAAHSGTNRFIGRFAYVAVPNGRALDINYIHNRVKTPQGRIDLLDGFNRNQGVGSWEINLAAFFRELNTNVWTYSFSPLPGVQSVGTAFQDATTILNYRYNNNYNNLLTVNQLFGFNAGRAYGFDGIDSYVDGPFQVDAPPALNIYAENDQFATGRLPWPGSDNTNFVGDVQQLFKLRDAQNSVAFDNLRARMNFATNPLLSSSSHDRYQFYRLFGQLGVDSEADWDGKMNLNYRSLPTSADATNAIPWTATEFFNEAADRLLRSEFGFGVYNIPLFPTNFYSARVHRLLQVAANLYDSTHPGLGTTISDGTTVTNVPSVFKPRIVSNVRNGTVVINGFREINHYTEAVPRVSGGGAPVWITINSNSVRSPIVPGVNAHGVPYVVAARKGFPNFNEFELKTYVQVSRKLETVRPNAAIAPTATNQMFLVGISNVFGIEAWNSYAGAYPRDLQLRATNIFTIMLTNAFGQIMRSNSLVVGVTTNYPAGSWVGEEFKIPLAASLEFLPPSKVQRTAPGQFNLIDARFNPQFDAMQPFPEGMGLVTTNQLTFALIDTELEKLIDYVSIDDFATGLDVSSALQGNVSALSGESSLMGQMWDTNRSFSPLVDDGVFSQMNASLGNIQVSQAQWRNYSEQADSGQTKEKSIDFFRVFHRFSPINFPAQANQIQNQLRNVRRQQAPFTPIRKLVQTSKLQANDPLVHYTLDDLIDFRLTNTVEFAVPPQNPLIDSNLGLLNERYRPWGGRPGSTAQAEDFDFRYKDPLITRSDDWVFPTNKFPNLGHIGRVHRGTPWQTIYLKSGQFDQNFTNSWFIWSGNIFTHPTNDWRLPDLFTTAPNANASRGLLSVNQPGAAAWSAVLSGITVLSNTLDNAQASGLAASSVPEYRELLVQPTSFQTPQVQQIVDSINQARLNFPFGRYPNLGSVLAAPGLSVDSPFLNLDASQRQFGIHDSAYERIPEKVLSLLKQDDPRFTVYAFGQSLTPAPNSVIRFPGPFFQMVTNYQITGEIATKTIMRLTGEMPNIRAEVEEYQVLPAEFFEP